jgi:predicted dehydrogenase
MSQSERADGGGAGREVNVAVIGCGVIGSRRARAAAADARSRVVYAVDPARAAADALAREFGGKPLSDWRIAVADTQVDAVVVATPTGYTAEIATAALQADKHVLLEKPPGRSATEAERIASVARASGRACQVGFNLRHHAGIRHARQMVADGALGRLLNLRVRYGHGGRPGCEREWRADPAVAGGGELLDQGVHVADLLRWFAGEPDAVTCVTQTAFWKVAPLEDNAFALLRIGEVVAQLHVSMTQWKNLFSLEVFGEAGSVSVAGLGGSYGPERVVLARRRAEGGAPDVLQESFPEDTSWRAEWDAFMRSVIDGAPVETDATCGAGAMRVIDALYESARLGGATVRLARDGRTRAAPADAPAAATRGR